MDGEVMIAPGGEGELHNSQKPGRGHVVLGDEVTPGFGEKRSEADGYSQPRLSNSLIFKFLPYTTNRMKTLPTLA